jgi:hypothetical protein
MIRPSPSPKRRNTTEKQEDSDYKVHHAARRAKEIVLSVKILSQRTQNSDPYTAQELRRPRAIAQALLQIAATKNVHKKQSAQNTLAPSQRTRNTRNKHAPPAHLANHRIQNSPADVALAGRAAQLNLRGDQWSTPNENDPPTTRKGTCQKNATMNTLSTSRPSTSIATEPHRQQPPRNHSSKAYQKSRALDTTTSKSSEPTRQQPTALHTCAAVNRTPHAAYWRKKAHTRPRPHRPPTRGANTEARKIILISRQIQL